MQRAVFLVAVLLVGQALADLYGQSGVRCSNNRLNEASANRNNANRLFDSQNNNRGGVNVGVRTNTDGSTTFAGPDTVYNAADLTTAAQYQLLFYETSIVNLEWTAQHGCGGNEENDPHQLNCNMVFQYMCDTTGETDRAMIVTLRDGTNTNTPDEPGSYADTGTEGNNVANGRGHHESEAYYYECKTRKRNRGLFLADQNLNGDTARFTRQNPNGGRSGLECPEERDYFPYFHATPWRDIAYLTDDVAGKCDSNYIASNSQNTADKYKCVGQNPAAPTNAQLAANNQADCATADGTWKSWRWNLAPPVCQLGDWSRVNHLGNGRNGQMLSFNWTLGTFAGMRDSPSAGYLRTFGSQNNLLKCVFRMRYNISTDDYDPWNTNSSSNDNANAGIVSPVRNNPTIDVGADLQGLRLAINTNQFGRTFQDRSHVFYVKSKPTTGSFAGVNKIVNLGVRGKRGNIVQTYPSIEYDFNPNRLHIPASEMASTMLHIQWTGSNTHNNGDPGGDGQTGDAGQGTGGTDRHNMVQMLNADENYPLPLDTFPANMWSASTCYQVSTTNNVDEQTAMNWVDCALMAATSGQIRRRDDADDNFDPLLNTAPASLIGGFLMKFQTAGDYFYMCTRNNSFSNRSQKGVIIVGNPA